MKYVSVDKLIADIDKKWKELADKNAKIGGGKYDIQISTYLSIKNYALSLQQEQFDVDLKIEIGHWLDKLDDKYYIFVGDYSIQDIKDTARHFYELGLKTRKEN